MLKNIFHNRHYLLIIFSLVLSNILTAERDDGVSQYEINGITGCACFMHCDCYSLYLDDFKNIDNMHSYLTEDVLWHTFMKKFLEVCYTAPLQMNYNFRTVVTNNRGQYVAHLSEYLNAIDKFRYDIEIGKNYFVEYFNKKIITEPRYKEKYANDIKKTYERTYKAHQILSTVPAIIIPLYKRILEDCDHQKPYNLAYIYNKGLISLMEGDIDGFLHDINSLIESAKITNNEKLLTSEIFQKQGESFIEVGLYHEAITSLNTAIQKDPKNLEAYFQRASAYFEIGDFEQALLDFLVSKKNEHIAPLKLAPMEFVDAFAAAILKGAEESVCNFIPSLCNSTYGLGQCLWAFGEHPIDSINHLANSCYEMCDDFIEYVKKMDQETLIENANELATELNTLYQEFDQLSDRQKAELIGHVIGKYGTEIFAGSKVVSTLSTYNKMKEANRLCNLESMALSQSSKEIISARALHQCSERHKFFENSRIHWDSQNKHVPGKHNYKDGKSVFEHSDPERLLKQYAGRGRIIRDDLGNSGYKELIDFKEHIGIWKNKKGGISPTSKGVIHYKKNGQAHIVPEDPSRKIW